MDRSLVLTLACVLAGSTARGGSPSDEPAARAWAITDAVLARHVDPPTRQQMLMAGLKALEKAKPVPWAGLASRVSEITTPDQFASLLAEYWQSAAKPDDKEKLEDAFFEGLLSVVPGGATLMSANERKVTESMDANLYVGIQVALGLDEKTKKPTFMQILEGGPAEHAGAKSGDLIETIDGVPAEGMPLRRVIDRLRGEEGTDVLIRFHRPGTGEDFTRAMTRGRLPRATIQGLRPLPGKRWEVRLDGPLPIGYLKLTEIAGSTPQELRVFAEQLETEGIKALVLDLREVHGARLHATVLLADALLDGGIIGRVKSADGERIYRAEPDALFRGWPMVVLAGRSPTIEVPWLCAALRDNRRATIIGDTVATRDPVVQETVTLPDGEWSVQLATGRLERGDGQPLAAFNQRPMGRDVRRLSTGEPPTDEKGLDQYPKLPSAPPGTDFAAPRQGPAGPRPPKVDPLPGAREILGEALKSSNE